jgi:hypothetical protein
MVYIPDENLLPLIVQAQKVLAFDNQDLAKLVKLSPRTITRWWSNESSPSGDHVLAILRAVHPKDATVSAQLATQLGHTLETLGVVVRPPPAPPAPPPPPPPPPRPASDRLVEAVVCAAAEALESTPAAVRPVLRAAFARARKLRMTVEEIDEALSPALRAPAAQAKKASAAAIKTKS